MIWKYPDDVAKFIADNVIGRTTKELAELTNTKFGTNFTATSMKSYKSNHDLKSGTQCGFPKGYSKMYPPEIQEFIKDNIVGRQINDLTNIINLKFETAYTASQIKAYVKNHRLISGVDCRIQKGNIPVNKGKKKMWVGGEETQFKKGQKPHNYLPVGTERINGEGYHDIKIADPDKWKAKHILLWEEYNGPVPKGFAVLFGDGDKDNISLDNLILVSRSQLSVLNRYGLIRNDSDLTRTGIIIADLKSKISKMENKKVQKGGA